MHITSKIKGRKDDDLLRRKWHRVAFPTMLFMDHTGDVITKQGARTIEAFHATRAKCMAYLALKENPKPGPAYAKALFFAEMGLARLTFAAAAKRAGSLELTEAERADVNKQLINLEYDDLSRQRFKLKDKFIPRLDAMRRADRIPSGNRARGFWMTLLRHADKNEDAALYRASLEGFEAAIANSERRRMFERGLERMRKRLAALEAGK